MIPDPQRSPRSVATGIAAVRRPAGAASGTIVVADADPHLRDICATILRFRGFRVLEAVDGLDAIEIVRDAAPDAAVLDIDLPHLTGMEAAALLAGQPTTASTRVVLLSNYDGPLVQMRALRAGCAGYVRKPFDPAELVVEVTRALGREAETPAPLCPSA